MATIEKQATEPITQVNPKKNPVKQAMKIFLAEDLNLMNKSIVDDYIKPRAVQFKDEAKRKGLEFLVDTLQNCISMLILGKPSGNSIRTINSTPTPYTTYWAGSGPVVTQTGVPVVQTVNSVNAMVKRYPIVDYSAAQSVLNILIDYIAKYTKTTVGDYHTLIGLVPKEVEYYYGWTNLNGTDILHTADGYIIDLPTPVQFK